MRFLLTAAFALATLPSCSLPEEGKGAPAMSETRPRLVGRIASIPAGGEFVLIESYGPWRVPEGGSLSGVGVDGRSSSLVVTGERLGRHVAADLRSGDANVGDPVYYRPLKDQPEPQSGPDGAEAGPAGAVETAGGSQKEGSLGPLD